MGCRNQEKAKRAVEEIREQTKCSEDQLRTFPLDTSDLSSVVHFVEQLEEVPEVHCLINNAGVMALPDFQTSDIGVELQFATNHLGHFRLTELLLPKLKRAAPSRVVNVSSKAHTVAPKKMVFPPPADQYGEWSNYGLSKICNVLHAKELQRRYGEEGITAVSLHPGVIKTELARNNTGAKIFYGVGQLFMKSIGQGAATQTRCAVSDELVGGGYYSDCQLKEPREDANSEELATSLWEASEMLVAKHQGPRVSATEAEQY
eukprot:TRINITY_DN5355_c0_g1_i1.p1 TRINITY_DN5355_c0_g1~~TRINITY_DN5355_c0_g1_i1.p1  ORF type:complete len:261 (+),score=71.95 TRINITY_DN5355_c0_g1_i1:173-955(+)